MQWWQVPQEVSSYLLCRKLRQYGRQILFVIGQKFCDQTLNLERYSTWNKKFRQPIFIANIQKSKNIFKMQKYFCVFETDVTKNWLKNQKPTLNWSHNFPHLIEWKPRIVEIFEEVTEKKLNLGSKLNHRLTLVNETDIWINCKKKWSEVVGVNGNSEFHTLQAKS